MMTRINYGVIIAINHATPGICAGNSMGSHKDRGEETNQQGEIVEDFKWLTSKRLDSLLHLKPQFSVRNNWSFSKNS
ncbi:hypothetical protein CK203_060306 [Vitis vinifera]|uniref:Uncharacterized protein n=1 Tax=Vitis vinifera TaxID=29760 RepID=A0A438GDL5_VITVI|nr:hypothetical protein CK203_109931 [Vitis vinifera]RVW70294.1 hypothetical protein CK203_060306 [Vitis vinifera]